MAEMVPTQNQKYPLTSERVMYCEWKCSHIGSRQPNWWLESPRPQAHWCVIDGNYSKTPCWVRPTWPSCERIWVPKCVWNSSILQKWFPIGLYILQHRLCPGAMAALDVGSVSTKRPSVKQYLLGIMPGYQLGAWKFLRNEGDIPPKWKVLFCSEPS